VARFRKPQWRPVLKLLRTHWKQLLTIHVAANVLSLLVLTPLYTALLGWLVLASGDVALTDQDILLFILSPMGGLIFVFALALLAPLLVFEQAALFLASMRLSSGHQTSLAGLGYDLLERAWPLFRLGIRMVVQASLIAAPFLALSGWLVYRYLTAFDINYYLSERPPELWWVGGAAALCLLAMLWMLLRVFAGWVIALPLLLLKEGNAAQVLRKSRQVAGSWRGEITLFLALWALAGSLLYSALGSLLDDGAGLAIRFAGGSLQMLAYVLGGLLVLWSLAHLAVTFLSACSLNLGMQALYRRLFPDWAEHTFHAQHGALWPMRRKRVSIALLAGAFVALSGTAGWVLLQAAERQAQEHPTRIIAHRGASAQAPENSLAAMELAIEQGADWVEIDVQETQAGEVVVIHDGDLMKVAGSALKVRDASLAQLESVDIGSRFAPEFGDQRVPTLQQLLERVQGRVKVLIELKYYGGEQALEERVATIVESVGVQDDVMLMSLSLPGVRRMKALRPDWQVGLLSSVGLGDVTRLDVDFFAVNARFAKRRFIQRARQRGRAVMAWTINDPALMSAMMGREVDGIITDKPGLARQIRAQRAELELHELLMIQVASWLGSERDLQQ
jgi:glycerophosphoryl diester phosphodiesterase